MMDQRVPQEEVVDYDERRLELQMRHAGGCGETGQHPSGILPEDGSCEPPPHAHRRHRHHKHHHHRMRMHDGNVRRLIDCDAETVNSCGQMCACDTMESHERIGNWGTRHPPKPQVKLKKSNPTQKRTRMHGSAGMIHMPLRDREALREDDYFRFRHYEDVGLFMKQYRQQHTICIQGADPTGPPVLGRDTPDPYLAKLRQCGDLLERLLAFTAMARQQAEEQDTRFEPVPKLAWVDLRATQKVPRLPAIIERNKNHQAAKELRLKIRCRLADRPLTKAVQHDKAAKDFSASSSPELTTFQFKTNLPRKAINLAPIRDCRLAVTNIKFPQAARPKRQPNHIQQQQQKNQQQQYQQQQQQQQQHQHAIQNDLDVQSPGVPLPARTAVSSDSMKGNNMAALSPPHTPKCTRWRLSRSESTERPLKPTAHQNNAHHLAVKFAKKRSEGDIHCPPLSSASASDISASDSTIYEQYIAHRKRISVKEETMGHLLFANATNASKGSADSSGKCAKPLTVGLCELYSSGSGRLIAAANNR